MEELREELHKLVDAIPEIDLHRIRAVVELYLKNGLIPPKRKES